ncbi:MAG: hypothetical protein MUF72_21670 [Elainella sp. Prado103]|jgi:hypothetical protein|nr:hypothetical protein [Elainella sp. Prado103]
MADSLEANVLIQLIQSNQLIDPPPILQCAWKTSFLEKKWLQARWGYSIQQSPTELAAEVLLE